MLKYEGAEVKMKNMCSITKGAARLLRRKSLRRVCMLVMLGLSFPGLAIASAGYGERGGNSSLKFSPDSKMIAFAYGNRTRPIRLIDLDTGMIIRILPLEKGTVSDLAFSPNGDLLAASITISVEPKFGEIRVWNTHTGKELGKTDTPPVFFISFLPDNKTVAYNYFAEVQLWNTENGTITKSNLTPLEVSQATDFLNALSAASREKGVYAAVERKEAAAITIKDSKTNDIVIQLPIDGVVQSLFFDSGGETLAVLVDGGKTQIHLWDTSSWTIRQSFYVNIRSVEGTFSPDGKLLAVHLDGNTIKIWDLTIGTPTKSIFLLMPRERLLEAVQKGQQDIVQALISVGVDVDARDPSDGRTALLTAGMAGQWDIFLQLLKSGADVNLADNYGFTSLINAASAGRSDVVMLLIDSGANINATDNFGRTALMWAAMSGHVETVKWLLNRSMDKLARDKRGRDALTHAASEGRVEVVKILVHHKLDVDTALAWASSQEIAEILISAGANVNTRIQDRRNETALSRAAEYGHIELAKTLINAAANVNVLRDDGFTPLMLAAEKGHLEITKLLLEAGANVNVRNSKGETTLTLVKAQAAKLREQSQYRQIVDLLEERGGIQ